MSIVIDNHYVRGTTSYGDDRCMDCEHNRSCYQSNQPCRKDLEADVQMYKDIEQMKKDIERLTKELEGLKKAILAGLTQKPEYTYGIR